MRGDTDWPAATTATRSGSCVSDPSQADAREREAAARTLDALDDGLRFYMTDYFFEYALLGDEVRSLSALRHHAGQPPKLWLEYLWWPELAAVRREPGFVAAMTDAGLTAVWNARGAPDFCQVQADGSWTCR